MKILIFCSPSNITSLFQPKNLRVTASLKAYYLHQPSPGSSGKVMLIIYSASKNSDTSLRSTFSLPRRTHSMPYECCVEVTLVWG
jgi:hypothetical protein